MSLVMTSGFPRDFPERADGVLPIARGVFDIDFDQAKTPLRGPKPQVVNLGTDLWKMEYTTTNLRDADSLQFSAWLQSLDGGARLFKAWDPRLKFPQAYPGGFAGMTKVGGGAFDGACSVDAFAETLDAVTLGGLPNGFKINIGDMVSLAWGGTQLLHRFIDTATANGFGKATAAVRPRLPISFGIDPAVSGTFVKPWCFAVIDAASIKGGFQIGQSAPISFSAGQTF